MVNVLTFKGSMFNVHVQCRVLLPFGLTNRAVFGYFPLSPCAYIPLNPFGYTCVCP